jgi:hypothetical protein
MTERDGNKYCVTKVFHKSGQFIEDEIPLVMGGRNDMQALGSALTYARRYSLQNLFGLAGDETDDDDGNKITPTKKDYAKEAAEKTNLIKAINSKAGKITSGMDNAAKIDFAKEIGIDKYMSNKTIASLKTIVVKLEKISEEIEKDN